MKHKDLIRNAGQQGFSLLELMMVVVIIIIISTFSILLLGGQRKLYSVDEQALQIVDLLQEARQRALTQREALRVEIDLTSNMGRLINENDPTKATDDTIVRQVTFNPVSLVRVDTKPNNISSGPPEPLPAPNAVFRGSLHPLSAGHNVCTFRFMRNGTVVDAGTNAIGAGAVITGTSLYIWKPKGTSPNDSDMTQAITVIGATGSVRMWGVATAANGSTYWKDSRRAGYGGGTVTATPAR